MSSVRSLWGCGREGAGEEVEECGLEGGDGLVGWLVFDGVGCGMWVSIGSKQGCEIGSLDGREIVLYAM